MVIKCELSERGQFADLSTRFVERERSRTTS